jgi:hypothetical protein
MFKYNTHQSSNSDTSQSEHIFTIIDVTNCNASANTNKTYKFQLLRSSVLKIQLLDYW